MLSGAADQGIGPMDPAEPSATTYRLSSFSKAICIFIRRTLLHPLFPIAPANAGLEYCRDDRLSTPSVTFVSIDS